MTVADDTYPEELYIDAIDVWDYSDELWDELLDLIAFEDGTETSEEPETLDDWYETEDVDEGGDFDDWFQE